VADLFGPRLRPIALGILTSANSLGTLLMFPLLGQISADHGWRAAFVAAGIPGVVVALLLFFTVRDPRRSAQSGQTPMPLTEAAGFFCVRRRS